MIIGIRRAKEYIQASQYPKEPAGKNKNRHTNKGYKINTLVMNLLLIFILFRSLTSKLINKSILQMNANGTGMIRCLCHSFNLSGYMNDI